MSTNEIIGKSDYVTKKDCGNYIEVYSVSNASFECHITKQSKQYYLNNRTGELKEFNYTNSSYKSMQHLRRPLNDLKALVLVNTEQCQNCLGITLTYKLKMRELDKAGKDFNRFIDKCKRAYGPFEYISVIEPQKRGVWHYHTVFIFDHKAPFIDNSEIMKKWKHGFTVTEKVESNIQLANYLASYNLDLYREAACELFHDLVGNYEQYTEVINGKNRTLVKGIAIRMLPQSLNIYRHSRNIKKPEISRGRKGELLPNKNELILVNSYTSTKTDPETNNIINQVKHEVYKKVK